MKLHALAVALLASLAASSATAQSANGSGGDMPALYDGQTFTINFKEMPDGAAEVLLANNTSLNIIYVSEDLLPDGTPFVAVLDAIQGDGFNPLWVEVEIEFTAGHTPRQLMDDNEVADAAANGEITLSSNGEIYRCSVVGSKN